MAKKNRLKKAANGLYFRNIGYRKTPKGYSQPKFYLGREQRQAEIANLMLEQLWEAVKRRWEARTPHQEIVRDHATELSPDTHDDRRYQPPIKALVTFGLPEVEYVREGKPVWDEVSLCVVEAIRSGDSIARVPVPDELATFPFESPSIGHWLDQLRRDFRNVSVHLELVDVDLHQEAESEIREEGDRLIEKGRRMVRQGVGGEMLHAALEEYAKAIERKYVGLNGKVSPTGTTSARQVVFLRETFPDCDLAELDTLKILMFQDVLAARPPGKRKKRIAVRSARNYIKQFRSFLKWLNTASGFRWKRPFDLEFARVRVPETVEERSAIARKSQVETYTIEEIGVLWRYATPLKRLLLLLGINCGFDAKMIATLQPADVCLHQKHPSEVEIGRNTNPDDSWIMRVRNKSSVYGEWKLWPITVQAFEWWLRQRETIDVAEGVTALIVNQKGNAYDTPTAGNDRNPQIPNLWNGLTTKIRNDENHQEFRRLSFGKLRKTAGNLIRKAGDGEIAGIFLCHGTPVRSDKLLDFYTNRDFGKVFDTIDIVGKQLQTTWATVEDPFPVVRKKGGGNISDSKVRRIQKLRKQGHKVACIAKQTGVSQDTVIRHSSKMKSG